MMVKSFRRQRIGILFIMLAIHLAGVTAHAQETPPNFILASNDQRIPGTADLIAPMPGGGYAVAGIVQKNFSLGADSILVWPPDPYVARYDASGKILWLHTARIGGFSDETRDLSVDADGNIYFSFYVRGSGGDSTSITFQGVSLPFQGGYLVKLTPAGEMEWWLIFGRGSWVDHVEIGRDQNIVLAGNLDFTYLLNGESRRLGIEGADDSCVSIAKITPEGAPVWHACSKKRTPGSPFAEHPSLEAMGLDPDDNPILSGNVYRDAILYDKLITEHFPGIFYLKLDGKTGEAIWLKSFAGKSSQPMFYPKSMAVDSAGNIYSGVHVGRYAEKGDYLEIGPTKYRSRSGQLIIKLTPEGGVAWSKMIGGRAGHMETPVLACDPNGSLYAAGRYSAGGQFDARNYYAASMTSFVTKIDGDGAVRWVKPFRMDLLNIDRSEKQSRLIDMALDRAGDILVAGMATSQIRLDNFTIGPPNTTEKPALPSPFIATLGDGGAAAPAPVWTPLVNGFPNNAIGTDVTEVAIFDGKLYAGMSNYRWENNPLETPPHSLFVSEDHGEHWSLAGPGKVHGLAIMNDTAFMTIGSTFGYLAAGAGSVELPFVFGYVIEGKLFALGDILFGNQQGGRLGIYNRTSGQWAPITDPVAAESRIVAMSSYGSTILAADRYGGVIRSTDRGLTWTKANNGLPLEPGDGLYAIASMTRLGDRIFIGFDNVARAETEMIHMSSDGGESWVPKSVGLRMQPGRDWPQRSITAMHEKNGRLFATELRRYWPDGALFTMIYVSENGGETWRDISDGLMPTRINAIAADDTYLYLAEEEGPLYRRPLAQLFAVDEGSSPEAAPSSALSCWPNPFTGSAMAVVRIDRPEMVRLELFDMSGKMVRELHAGEMPRGEHLLTIDASGIPAGGYILRLRAGDVDASRAVIIAE